MLTLDHIAIACTDLNAGSAWVEGRLGVPLLPGGAHERYATHNRLLGLGDIYLEVIAPDPNAQPRGARWFGLDHVSGPPHAANWICRTSDFAVAPEMVGPAVQMTRGDLQWQITVPYDGSLPMGGAYPTLLQWALGTTPPADSLPDSGIRLTRWEVRHPLAHIIAEDLALDDPRIVFITGPQGFTATFETPNGLVSL